jgi:predicted 3-demethylubiquinone-9 3-methyltransferase (glyoxalase superfamily)
MHWLPSAGRINVERKERRNAMQASRQKITPFLWFDRQAEEAVSFYTSIFKNSKIVSITRYGEEGAQAAGMPKETVMTMAFQLDGQEFVALNGGPHFKFTEAISFVVDCDSQNEVDYYWENLSEGGDEKAQQCGWLKDKYGVSWQIVPAVLNELLSDPDPVKSGRVMKAMLPMKKIDIEALKQAYKTA